MALQLHQATLLASATSLGIVVAGASALMFVAWAGRAVKREAFLVLIAALGAGALAYGSVDLRASARLAEALTPELEGRELIVTGVVASLPQRSSAGSRFQFEVEEARSAAGRAVNLPSTLAIGWYSGFFDAPADPPAGGASNTKPDLRGELRAGQRWRFTLKLRRPHGNLNPGGFDYELMLFEQGIRATGYVRESPAPVLLDRAAGHWVERLRQRVRDAIDASVPDRRASGLLAALAVGDQGAIERDDWDLYRNTGIAHLVSISGLHITMFAWLAQRAVGAVWRRSRRASMWWPAASAAQWGGVILAAAYAVFSGWGVPSQRTVWMLVSVATLRSLGARWPWPLVLLAAAVVVTLVDPWALLQAGFWLSFTAVGLLMATSPVRQLRPLDTAVVGESGDAPTDDGKRELAKWLARTGLAIWRAAKDGMRTQLVATLGLAPLSLVFFQQISVVGFAANMVAIPLVTLVITPLALLGCALVPLWTLGAWAAQLLNSMLESLLVWPLAVWSVPSAPHWAQFAAMLGSAVVMVPLPWRVRAMGLPLVLVLVSPPLDLPARGAFELIAADVGLRTREHVLVFDAGPQYARDSDAGKRVLVPLLRSRGEWHVDRLVLSHRDLDHVGGARALFGAVRIDDMLSSLEAEHPLQAIAAGRSKRCEAGQHWVWDGVSFTVLRPLAGDYERNQKSNAMSCVLRVSDARGRSVLLTGDIERDQEAELVARMSAAAGADGHANLLRSDVLFAPHHGSRTSSSAALLDAVAPSVAIVQAGYRNRFGHPAGEVLERYRERGIRVVASPSCGAWRWVSSAPGDSEGVCQRDAVRRYWQDRVDDTDDQP